MSHPQKKKRSVFLASKLTLLDYLMILGALVLIALVVLLIPNVLNTLGELDSALGAYSASPRLVPARSVLATHNTSQLWNKNDFFVANVSSRESLFFTPGEQSLVYPAANEDEGTYAYVLEAVDIVTGQTRWQTSIPKPEVIRIYNNKFVVLAPEWLDQAPAIDNQELSYCSFGETHYSLSTYDVSTGQKIWGYGYRGANLANMYFTDQSVYLAGSHDHGNHGLLISIDMHYGHIIHQRCNGPNPAPPRGSQGVYGSAFDPNAIDEQEYGGCSRDNRYCSVTEGNRLNILAGDSKNNLAYIDFDGAALTDDFIDVVVHNNIVVIHLLDSHQLFAFRLP